VDRAKLVGRLRDKAADMRQEALAAMAEKLRTGLLENADYYERLAKMTDRQQHSDKGLAD
jgi:hypothetical protein